MNYKVMQRPMFKLGGKAASQGTGITSGLDEKIDMTEGRVNYENGPMTSQDFLDRAMKNYNLRQEKMADMDSLINLQALGRVGNVLATEQSNNPLDILQNIAMSGTEIALPALSAKKKLELKALDPTTDLAFAKALKKDRPGSQKVYEMKLKNLAALEEKEAQVKSQFKAGTITQEQYNDEMQFINRRLKMITSNIMTDNDYKQMAIEDLIEQFGASGVTPDLVKQRTKTLKDIFETSYADGGRVGRMLGSPMTGEQPMMNVEQQDVAMETKDQGPAGQDAYAMLRARLPQEVPDDVVRLIAYNKEAFADFASIKNQEDVTSFNQKYNVSMNIDVSTV